LNDVTAGAIATSDPRATEAGAAVLRAGGNCVDAAVAAAFVLFVVEPHHCGPGGDAFLLVRPAGAERPIAFDGAGATPRGLDGTPLASVPYYGGASVTVPAAPALLERAAEDLGSWPFASLLEPAIAFASDGFVARPTLAAACAGARSRLALDPVLGPLYASVEVDTKVVNPALGDALARFGAESTRAMYEGEIAREIEAVATADGGALTVNDLVMHTTNEVTPVATEYAGATVWQMPAPTQGPAVLGALDRLGPDAADDWAAVADAIRDGLLDVGVDLVNAPWRRAGGTSHIAVVDADGGVASLITSVFAPFGARLGVAALGSSLQNRAAGYHLIDTAPTGGAKPPHTIIPGLVTRAGGDIALGVAGGMMQAQGQVQLLVRMLARGESAQVAIDAPRLRVVDGGVLALEPGHALGATDPEALQRAPGDGGFGCAQIAVTGPDVVAAADHRRDGAAAVVPRGA
jgi:gamma-glutamyltranspeptidase/glutathione hydrolase